MMFLYIFFVSLLLCLMLFILSKAVMIKSLKFREYSSPFECGFDPNNKVRSSFSARFFLFMVLFLIFDIEVVLILPVPLGLIFISSHMLPIFSFFILVLVLSLLKEWEAGALEWA